MKYVIASDIKQKRFYFATGPMRWMDNITDAAMFKTEASAINYTTNGTTFFDDRLSKLLFIAVDEESKDILKAPTLVNEDNVDTIFENIIKSIETLYNFRADSSSLYSYYNDERQKCDMATQDILHKIELYPINGIIALKLCKQLKEIRKKRRVCKNRLELLNNLKSVIDFSTPGKVLMGWENELKTKTYTPRVLKELFEEVKGNGDNKAQ